MDGPMKLYKRRDYFYMHLLLVYYIRVDDFSQYFVNNNKTSCLTAYVLGREFLSQQTNGHLTFIQAILIAPLQVHFYSEALPTQHGYCVGVSRRSATGNIWALYEIHIWAHVNSSMLTNMWAY